MNSMTEILINGERTGKSYWEYVRGMRGKRHLGLLAGEAGNHAGCQTGIDRRVCPARICAARFQPIICKKLRLYFPPVARTGKEPL